MNSRVKQLLTTSLMMLCLASLLMLGCSAQQEEAQEERLIPVKATVVENSREMITKTYTGSLEGEKQAVLYARLAEPIERIHVQEGQKVSADQILISLDRYGPTSNYPETESVFRNAEKNFNKMKYLFEEGAISETQYDAALTEYQVAKAQFEAMSKMVDIRTPIAGTVTSITVSPGDFVAQGQELATVATTGKLRVKFNVNPDEIGRFAVGDQVMVGHETIDRKMTGRVVTIAESADPATRAFQVEALVDDVIKGYRPGMFVQIEYILKRLDSVITVPQKSVLTMDNQTSVYVVKDGVAERREVALGDDLTGRVVVESGLNLGDTLVTLGQDYLSDGARVNLTSLNGNDQ